MCTRGGEDSDCCWPFFFLETSLTSINQKPLLIKSPGIIFSSLIGLFVTRMRLRFKPMPLSDTILFVYDH